VKLRRTGQMDWKWWK